MSLDIIFILNSFNYDHIIYKSTVPSNTGVKSCFTSDLANLLTAPVQKACPSGSSSCYTFTFSALSHQSAPIKDCSSNCTSGNGQDFS